MDAFREDSRTAITSEEVEDAGAAAGAGAGTTGGDIARGAGTAGGGAEGCPQSLNGGGLAPS